MHGKKEIYTERFKKIETYKTVFQKEKKDESSITNLKESFTDFGALKDASYFDGQGGLTQTDVFEYDKKHFNFKTLSKNMPANISSISTRQIDTINKTETTIALINDGSKRVVKFFFNDKGKVVKQLNINGMDTIAARTTYKIDNAGNIVSESRFEGKDTEPAYVDCFWYDKNRNIVSSSFTALGSTKLIETEWKDGMVFKRTKYTTSQDSKKQRDEETEYDNLYNPIDWKIYHDSKLIRESKYSYQYDKNGNWIKMQVAMKDYAAGSQFSPIYEATREIKYWE